MLGLVSPDDVRSRWVDGDFPEISDVVLGTRIGDAEMVVEAEFPDVYRAAAAGDARMLHRVVRVVAGMVVRLLSNPAGASSVTEQAGPFSTTATHGSGVGDVHLTEADRRILRGVTDADRGRAFTLWPGVAC